MGGLVDEWTVYKKSNSILLVLKYVKHYPYIYSNVYIIYIKISKSPPRVVFYNTKSQP